MSRFGFPKIPDGLSSEQKVASILLLFLGLGGVIIGFLSFGSNIRRPFEERLAKAPRDFAFASEKEAQDVEASKHRDTDGDGLSDYDEIYIYHTSPYLADTDSDGIDDKTEVYAGADPNCPKGKECAATRPILSADSTGEGNTTSLPLPSVPESGGLAPASGGAFKTEAEIIAYLKSLTPAQARSMLIQSGLAADKLKNLTDAQVRDLFDKTIDQAAKDGQFKALLKAQAKTP